MYKESFDNKQDRETTEKTTELNKSMSNSAAHKSVNSPPFPRLPVREYKDDNGKTLFIYVFNEDIVKFHGEEWAKKYFDVAGVNTCPVIDKNIPEGYTANSFAMYYWDYSRFADVVDKGITTYWD